MFFFNFSCLILIVFILQIYIIIVKFDIFLIYISMLAINLLFLHVEMLLYFNVSKHQLLNFNVTSEFNVIKRYCIVSIRVEVTKPNY